MSVELKFDFELDSALMAMKALEAGADSEALLMDIGEALRISTRKRFETFKDPDGKPWEPLAKSTLRRKRNKSKILVESTELKGGQVYQVEGRTLLVGNNRKHGRIHQLGGTIEKKARTQTLNFRMRNKAGDLKKGFVKASKSNFAMDVEIGAHEVEIPARPYLGISLADRVEILEIISDHLESALSGRK